MNFTAFALFGAYFVSVVAAGQPWASPAAPELTAALSYYQTVKALPSSFPVPPLLSTLLGVQIVGILIRLYNLVRPAVGGPTVPGWFNRIFGDEKSAA